MAQIHLHSHTHIYRHAAHSLVLAHLFACTRAGQILRCLLAFGTGAQHYRHTCCCLAKALKSFEFVCHLYMCSHVLACVCVCVSVHYSAARACASSLSSVSCEWQWPMPMQKRKHTTRMAKSKNKVTQFQLQINAQQSQSPNDGSCFPSPLSFTLLLSLSVHTVNLLWQ